MIGMLSLGAVVFEALGEQLPTADAYERLAALLLQPPPAGDDPMARVRAAAADAAATKAALDDALAAAVAAGHTLREVGAAAGLSHERVRAARDR